MCVWVSEDARAEEFPVVPFMSMNVKGEGQSITNALNEKTSLPTGSLEMSHVFLHRLC